MNKKITSSLVSLIFVSGLANAVILDDQNNYLVVAEKLESSSDESPSEPDFIVSSIEEWRYDTPPVITYPTTNTNGHLSPDWNVTNYDFNDKFITAKIDKNEEGTQYKYTVNTYNSGKVEAIKTGEEREVSLFTEAYEKTFDLTKECFYSSSNFLSYHEGNYTVKKDWAVYMYWETTINTYTRNTVDTKEYVLEQFENEYGITHGDLMYSSSTGRTNSERYSICATSGSNSDSNR